ncbi:hypothetical protein BJ684DRAFT_17384, partial [Piptocephalis cylindrospora]
PSEPSRPPIQLPIPNINFANGSWEDDIDWEGDGGGKDDKGSRGRSSVCYNLNDPNLLLEITPMDETEGLDEANEPQSTEGDEKFISTQRIKTSSHSSLASMLHVSGDLPYVLYQKNSRVQAVRQTLGQVQIQHSLPAVKLYHPYYKHRLSKNELRSFHRPSLHFPPGTTLSFSHVRSYKIHRRWRKQSVTEIIPTTRELSLRENCPYMLVEYSEESPPVLSNVGMGSMVVNYHRRRAREDPAAALASLAKFDIGEPSVLGPTDASPLLNFGDLVPGETLPILCTNLYRAPLFRHTPESTDFLVIRHVWKGEVKCFLRPLGAVFTAGQIFPLQEVPSPQSRKITTTVRNRMQVFSYRTIRKHGHHLSLGRLARAFPEFNEAQIRQKLKEFMEYRRSGGHGFWRPRGGGLGPPEEVLRDMVTPEMRMQATGRMDLLRGGAADEEDGGGEGKEMDVEQQLAPWIITRNFLQATQNKSMLRLYGPGDPTGRGEAFDFRWISMKSVSLRHGETMEERLQKMGTQPKSGHRYNVAEQQAIYREEITRIWRAQCDSLRRVDIPRTGEGPEDGMEDGSGGTMPGPFEGKEEVGTEDGEDTASVAGSHSTRGGGASLRKKYVVIRRKVRSAAKGAGSDEWKTEEIRDPAVVKAYIKARQLIEDQRIDPNTAEPTTDAEKNRRMRTLVEQQLAKLKRNQERRASRAAQKSGSREQILKNESKRRCGNCGVIGHMRTNRACPMWRGEDGQPAQIGVAKSSSSSSTPTTGANKGADEAEGDEGGPKVSFPKLIIKG